MTRQKEAIHREVLFFVLLAVIIFSIVGTILILTSFDQHKINQLTGHYEPPGVKLTILPPEPAEQQGDDAPSS